jgi:hypothetical protein
MIVPVLVVPVIVKTGVIFSSFAMIPPISIDLPTHLAGIRSIAGIDDETSPGNHRADG